MDMKSFTIGTFRVFSILTAIIGIILFFVLMDTEKPWPSFLSLGSGILSCASLWGMSIIIKACSIYVDNHEDEYQSEDD